MRSKHGIAAMGLLRIFAIMLIAGTALVCLLGWHRVCQYPGYSLIDAAYDSDVTKVRLLLGLGVDPNTVGEKENTALGWAVCNDDEEIAGLLLNAGANPNARHDSGKTEVMYAAGGGHLGCLRLLLRAGGDVRARDQQGHSALYWAVSNHQIEAARILKQEGATE